MAKVYGAGGEGKGGSPRRTTPLEGLVRLGVRWLDAAFVLYSSYISENCSGGSAEEGRVGAFFGKGGKGERGKAASGRRTPRDSTVGQLVDRGVGPIQMGQPRMNGFPLRALRPSQRHLIVNPSDA